MPEHIPFLRPKVDSTAQLIHGTPVVELHRLANFLGLSGRLFAKVEFFSPGLSKKDRIALEIVEEAKRNGQLVDGQPVVELTSGNTGTGLAIVCQSLGHPFIAVISRGNSIERAIMMNALGAKVVLVDQAPGGVPGQVSGPDLDLVEQQAQKLVKELGAFRADQFANRANFLAHYRHTGPEFYQQTSGQIDVLVDFAGTGGTLAGTAAYLKEIKPGFKAYCVEPASAAALAGKTVTNPGHKIQGGGYSKPKLPLVDPKLVDGYLAVSDEEAIEHARLLARHEGLFGGFSSGANLAGAVRVLRGPEKGKAVGFVVCDSGLKYASTDLYQFQA
jgi:cysteine synthase A